MAVIAASDVVTYETDFNTIGNCAKVVTQADSIFYPSENGYNPDTPIPMGMPFLYTAANWENVEFKLRAYFKAAAGTVYADLYDVTAAAQVASSLLTSSSITLTTYTSAALTLIDNHTYMLRVYKATGGSGAILNASLFVRMI